MFGNGGQSRGKSFQGSNSRAFSLFVMVISIYTLGSLWFIMFPTRDSIPLIKEEPMPIHNIQVGVQRYQQQVRYSAAQISTQEPVVEEPVFFGDNGEIDNIVNEASNLKGSGRWEEAMAALNRGLEKYPKADKLLGHKGGWYFDKEQWDHAAEYFKKAHEQNKKDYYWVQNVAMCLGKLGRGKEASTWLWTAYDMNPSLGTLVSICDTQWKFNDFYRYQELLALVMEKSRAMIARGDAPDINPFSALHLPFNLEELYAIAKGQVKFMEDLHNKNSGLDLPKNTWDGKRKIRVGYISPDLRHHAVGITIQNMFEFHNRSKYEILAFSCYDQSNDEITAKIRAHVDEFIEVYDKDPVAAARKINDHKPDILIDLGLFTAYARMDVFALNPAPIQVAWLGLASTTGSRFYDYVIGDHTVVLKEHEPFYAEKIVRMPHSYHIFDHKQYYPYTPTRQPVTRHQYSTTLPDDLSNPPVFFCNYANNYRLDPYIFHRWLEIIKKTPNSALILKYYNDESMNNLLNEIRENYPELAFEGDPKVDWPRVLFHRGGGQDHIAMKTVCDIHLDVPKYNGHSTSGDLLWGGVPIITEPLTTMASRAAASFCTTSGIQDMGVAKSPEDYVSKAVYYGTNREELAAVRKKLEDGRMENPLFDTYLFTKHLEDAYTQMMTIKFIEGEPARSINVNNLINVYGARALKSDAEKQQQEQQQKEQEQPQAEEHKEVQQQEEQKDAPEANVNKEDMKDNPVAGPKELEDAIAQKKIELAQAELQFLQNQKAKVDGAQPNLLNKAEEIAGEVKDKAADAANNAEDKAGEVVGKIKEAVKPLFDKMKERFDQKFRPGAELNPIAAAKEDGEDNMGVNPMKVVLPQ